MATKPKTSAGWIFTFADLMALILTFFVLLLSFSTINAKKYEEIARSFGAVFGEGTGIIPDGGMSVVRPISVTVPLRPAPEPVRRPVEEAPPPPAPEPAMTVSVSPAKEEPPPAPEPERAVSEPSPEEEPALKDEALLTKEREAARLSQLSGRLLDQFQGEIDAGLVELETRDDDVLVRFRESISFPSGEAVISGGFNDVLYRMGNILRDTPGIIVVSGHTDDRPIHSDRYRSNWELSAARAVSVVHYLVEKASIPKERMIAQGYADSSPLVANDTDERRARNRRVEITIRPPVPN